MQMEMITEAVYKDLGDGIYNISAVPGGFQEYVILGSEKAALIDTGMGIGTIKDKVEEITDLPVTLICTHGHPDHAGGNAEFEPALMNPADFDVFEKMAAKEFRIQDVQNMPKGIEFVPRLQETGPYPKAAADGEEIDLGGRVIKIIFAPGHTHGSLCVFDTLTKTLFTGDNVQAVETALREWNSSSVEEYIETLNKLKQLGAVRIMGGHKPNIMGPDQIDKLISAAKDIVNGAEGFEKEMRGGGKCLAYEKDGVRICYTKENIKA